MKQYFNFTPTPLTKIQSFSKSLECDFYMKREDLFEEGGGGSKSRMLQYIIWDAKMQKADYILTAGGPYSNFNRALALMCKKHDLKMRLVLYDKNPHINVNSLNKRIIDYCEVELVKCDPDYVPETINIERDKLINDGMNVYYIWGGGKSKQGVMAYYDACLEITNQLSNIDYIFTAVGTGTTYSGLYTAAKTENLSTKIVGISVARKKRIAEEVIFQIINEASNLSNRVYQDIEINDDYVMGGYGKSNKDLDSFIQDFVQNEGIIIDSIYVGKALFGTYEYLNKIKNHIQNKKIVFLNTGGLYNF